MGSAPYRELLSAIAVALTFAAFIPYVRAIRNIIAMMCLLLILAAAHRRRVLPHEHTELVA